MSKTIFLLTSHNSISYNCNIVVFKNSNRVKVEGDFISYLPESEPFLSFQEGSISIHEVQSVAYTQNESCLESYLHDMKYGHY